VMLAVVLLDELAVAAQPHRIVPGIGEQLAPGLGGGVGAELLELPDLGGGVGEVLGVPALVKEGGEVVDAAGRLDRHANVVGNADVVAGRARLLQWLASLPKSDLRLFERLLSLHATHLRGACASSPELLDAIGDKIPVESNFGEVDLPTLLSASGGDRVLRVVDSPQAFAHVSPLATAQGLPLVNAIYLHDRPFLEAWARRRNVELLPMSVDALEVLLRPAHELLPRFAAVLGRARALLEPLDVEPEIGRFEPASLPGFLVTEPTQLRERARELVKSGTSDLARNLLRGLQVARGERGIRFVLNVDNPLVAALPEADLELAAFAVRLCYAQSAMLVRRTFSLGEARVFSEDLGRLLSRAVGVRGDLN